MTCYRTSRQDLGWQAFVTCQPWIDLPANICTYKVPMAAKAEQVWRDHVPNSSADMALHATLPLFSNFSFLPLNTYAFYLLYLHVCVPGFY